MKRQVTTLVFAAFAGSAAALQNDAVCVRNGSEEVWLFVVENAAGGRVAMELEQGQELCANPTDVTGKGTVSVFESEDVVEGCSRRIEAGTTEVMLAYSEFDRCLWSSNAD